MNDSMKSISWQKGISAQRRKSKRRQTQKYFYRKSRQNAFSRIYAIVPESDNPITVVRRSHPSNFFVFFVCSFYSRNTGNGQSLNLLNGLAFVQRTKMGRFFCCFVAFSTSSIITPSTLLCHHDLEQRNLISSTIASSQYQYLLQK